MKKIFFIVIILVLSISACKTSKPSIYQPPVEQIVVAEEPVQEVVVEEMPELPVVVKTEEVTLVNEENNDDKMFDFYVIIGSFKKQENANKLQEQQISKGYSSVVLKSETGMFRVAVTGTNSEYEARQLIGEIRVKTPEHNDAWLLKKK